MLRFAGLSIFLASASVAIAAPSSLDARWDVVATDRDGQCALAITGNGQFFRIAAEGLVPGATGRYTLTNSDMKPIDWTIRADAQGRFARFYLPFRYLHEGGEVVVSVQSEHCSVAAAFDWRRAQVRVY